jgi:malonate decarboxylase gamma subunit
MPVMTLDEVLASLFPAGHSLQRGAAHTLHGTGRLEGGGDVALIGVADSMPLGIDGTSLLAGHVLSIIKGGSSIPILLLIDASIQNMTRRDELLGLNEYFGHLIKVLSLAARRGHRTIALLYGPAAGGAFIATALAAEILAAIPGGEPSVMDLPSIARVTKLPLGQLNAMAKTTPIFAPGIEPLFLTGAVTEKWDTGKPLAEQLANALRTDIDTRDRRDEIGRARKGRLEAAAIAQRVAKEAAHG